MITAVHASLRLGLVALALALWACHEAPQDVPTIDERAPAAVDVVATVPSIGDLAPDFTLMDSEGRSVSLADARGRKVVLVFYRAHW